MLRKFGAAALLSDVVFADQPQVADLLKQMNLKENAKDFFSNLKVDPSKFQANSGQLAKELGFEDGFNLGELSKSAHEMANDFGMGSYYDSLENTAKSKFQGMDGSVMKQGQDIWQHVQQKAGTEGLGNALKSGMNEAMQYSQSNPAMRDALSPLKEEYSRFKTGGSKSMMYDAASYAAHNPIVENMLESNGFHVQDLLHKLEPSDPTGKAGLNRLMSEHRAQVEANFDANNTHFSYFFSFVIFVVLCAIAVALYEIHELRNKKKKKPTASECPATNMV